MSYATRAEANAAMQRAFEEFKQQYKTGNNRYNIPWSDKQAFNDKWFPIVEQAGRNEAAASNNPSIPYNQFTPEEKQTYDNRVDFAAAEAYANPNFSDPGPPVPTFQAGAAGPQGMTTNEYEYQKAIDLANISAQSGERIATIGKESALGVAGIQKESALGVANIDKQIKQMQLESAENIAKLSNINKSALANIATNQSILTGLVNAFNF